MELILGLVALILVLYWLYYALDYQGLEKPANRSAPLMPDAEDAFLARGGSATR